MTSQQPNETHDAQREERKLRDAEMARPDVKEVVASFIGSGHTRREPRNTDYDVQPARDILGCGMKELADREQTYDAPGGERSMAKTVAAFNAIYGLGMTEVQGWQFMELLKIVRSSQGKFKPDNFVDGAAYAALAGEAASRT